MSEALVNDLESKDFKYECLSCGDIISLADVEDAECDGDVCGTCPSCGNYSAMLPA